MRTSHWSGPGLKRTAPKRVRGTRVHPARFGPSRAQPGGPCQASPRRTLPSPARVGPIRVLVGTGPGPARRGGAGAREWALGGSPWPGRPHVSRGHAGAQAPAQNRPPRACDSGPSRCPSESLSGPQRSQSRPVTVLSQAGCHERANAMPHRAAAKSRPALRVRGRRQRGARNTGTARLSDAAGPGPLCRVGPPQETSRICWQRSAEGDWHVEHGGAWSRSRRVAPLSRGCQVPPGSPSPHSFRAYAVTWRQPSYVRDSHAHFVSFLLTESHWMGISGHRYHIQAGPSRLWKGRLTAVSTYRSPPIAIVMM
jgi:hypothetical protein